MDGSDAKGLDSRCFFLDRRRDLITLRKALMTLPVVFLDVSLVPVAYEGLRGVRTGAGILYCDFLAILSIKKICRQTRGMDGTLEFCRLCYVFPVDLQLDLTGAICWLPLYSDPLNVRGLLYA